ncbi:MAG: carbohydrate-binding domain-containing protein, partial [Treponemataceae bacterium]|nr:carbohydrate-binding domain-containing protein [Treponemataceae bacterium]
MAGTVAGAADDSKSILVKQAMAGKADLSALAANTAGADATEIAATDAVVEISASGTYSFKGEYGGIKITTKGIDVHFIFDGATFTNNDGIAIDGADKKPARVIITLADGTTNAVTNGGEDVNAIHVKAPLFFNGTGTLHVTSHSKSAVKSSKAIQIVDATLCLAAENHALTGLSVTAVHSTIAVTEAGKDGINAECGSPEDGFSTDDGFVVLKDVAYTCDVSGDGIQADTAVYIDGGTYAITTTGTFVQNTAANMAAYDMTADDFKYTKSGSTYKRIASDETNRYGSNLYGLSQGCKGIKVGEIEYTDDAGNTVTVTDGDYLIAIVGGMFGITSTDDAIHANGGNVLIEGGTFAIATADDGITADALTKITGGSITVTACYEGIEGGYVEISGDSTVIDVTASD